MDERFLDIAKHIELTPNTSILEFGVMEGNSLDSIIEALLSLGKVPKQVIGFDAFKGLPDEEEGVRRSPDWNKGAFDLAYELTHKGTYVDTEEGIEIVKARFKKYLPKVDVKFVVGWYDQLNSDTIKEFCILPASYVHIDCDLYISSYQAMKFLCDNNLIAEGCIIRYDDWQNDPEIGEQKTHWQILKEYNLKAEYIYNDYNQVYFRFYSN